MQIDLFPVESRLLPVLALAFGALALLAAARIVRNKLAKGLFTAYGSAMALLSVLGMLLAGLWISCLLMLGLYVLGILYTWKSFTPYNRGIVECSLAAMLALFVGFTAVSAYMVLR